MNKSTKGNTTTIGLVILVLIIIGFFALRGGDTEGVMEGNMENESHMTDDMMEEDSMTEGDSMMGGEAMEKEDSMMGETMSTGSYEVYSPEKVALAATEGDVVLFFHATWCPTCRALNSDIEKNISSIPKDLTILKTDYDTYTDLKKKYGITVQHTLVQVDKDGNLIKKWSGSPSLNDIISKVI